MRSGVTGSFAVAGALLVGLLVACQAPADEKEDAVEPSAAAYSGTTAAYSGATPTLVEIDKPSGAPDAWEQPPSEGKLGQNGYCGAAAASNLLRWYGKEVAPRSAIDNGCWSYVGTLPGTLAAYLRTHHPELDCYYQRMAWTADALTGLRNALAAGRPVIVEYMTGELNAHWVTVTGVRGSGESTELVVMSWGRYYTARWADFKDAWRSAWGGYYPYVMCNEESPLRSGLETGQ